jgi:hypothetical protein
MIQICLLSFISDSGIRISNFFNEEGLLDLMSISRARVRHIFSAKGAAFTSSLGRRPRFVESETASAESAIHFAEQLDHHSLHAPVAQ